MPFEKLIKVAFGFRNMSRKNIEHVFNTEEKAIKKLKAKNSQNQLNMNEKYNQRKNSVIHKMKSAKTNSGNFAKVNINSCNKLWHISLVLLKDFIILIIKDSIDRAM